MSGRRLARLLWPALALYAALVSWRAHGELTQDDVVRGLFRTYLPPQRLAIGWLFDARPGDLAAEIDARLGTRGPPPADQTPAAWRAALEARGFTVEASSGHGAGEPRLVFVEGGPWLITGRAEQRPIAFDPRRGMLLVEEGAIPPEAFAWILRR